MQFTSVPDILVEMTTKISTIEHVNGGRRWTLCDLQKILILSKAYQLLRKCQLMWGWYTSDEFHLFGESQANSVCV